MSRDIRFCLLHGLSNAVRDSVAWQAKCILIRKKKTGFAEKALVLRFDKPGFVLINHVSLSKIRFLSRYYWFTRKKHIVAGQL